MEKLAEQGCCVVWYISYNASLSGTLPQIRFQYHKPYIRKHKESD